MSLPRYPNYKDSGVEWLGEVPAHWQVIRLKYLVHKVGSGKTPLGGSEVYTSEGVLFLRSQNVYDEGLRLDDAVFIAPKIDQEMANTRVEAGDILLNVTGASIGRTCLVPTPFVNANVNQHVCIIRISETAQQEFIAQVMKAAPIKNQIAVAQGGAARDGLNFDQIRGLVFGVTPEPGERDAIVSFLSRETGKIDALVEEQRRLIELLKEKRQAVISHAVTKGLNPDAPMKDSGIEWLGEMPHHWTIRRLKSLSQIRYGIGEPPPYRQEGTPLIRATNVNAGTITPDGLVYVDPDDIPAKRIVWLQSGDIIVVRSGAYTGDSAIILKEHLPSIAGFDMVLRAEGCNQKFLQYVLLSDYMKAAQIDLERTRAAQPHLNAEELGNCRMLLPPPEEQTNLVSFLDSEILNVDMLSADATLAIDLLQERRTALISAAVTGKIDVRGLVKEDAA